MTGGVKSENSDDEPLSTFVSSNGSGAQSPARRAPLGSAANTQEPTGSTTTTSGDDGSGVKPTVIRIKPPLPSNVDDNAVMDVEEAQRPARHQLDSVMEHTSPPPAQSCNVSNDGVTCRVTHTSPSFERRLVTVVSLQTGTAHSRALATDSVPHSHSSSSTDDLSSRESVEQRQSEGESAGNGSVGGLEAVRATVDDAPQ